MRVMWQGPSFTLVTLFRVLIRTLFRVLIRPSGLCFQFLDMSMRAGCAVHGLRAFAELLIVRGKQCDCVLDDS
jgi:hypothetical protein